ncbi:hypothetical protein [Lelliottia amnigena]|uniref:hypothetical protein n=1 Tax=Lelliottia amnigena TaxID=61646 RepID=UPI001C5C8371|nr:hypothetical protein [Lelliottia amnigena]QXZ18273.1 hypothetical protein I6L75_14235 [Lelliottia amnigena]
MEYGSIDWLFNINELDEMSKKDYLQVRQITPQVFIAFLVDRGVKMTCQSCGKDTLFVPHTIEHDGDDDEDDEDYDESKDITYVTPKPLSPGPFRIHSAKYEVNCSNCGFISHYLTYKVLEWAKQNGAIKDE